MVVFVQQHQVGVLAHLQTALAVGKTQHPGGGGGEEGQALGEGKPGGLSQAGKPLLRSENAASPGSVVQVGKDPVPQGGAPLSQGVEAVCQPGYKKPIGDSRRPANPLGAQQEAEKRGRGAPFVADYLAEEVLLQGGGHKAGLLLAHGGGVVENMGDPDGPGPNAVHRLLVGGPGVAQKDPHSVRGLRPLKFSSPQRSADYPEADIWNPA